MRTPCSNYVHNGALSSLVATHTAYCFGASVLRGNFKRQGGMKGDASDSGSPRFGIEMGEAPRPTSIRSRMSPPPVQVGGGDGAVVAQDLQGEQPVV